jgi:tetratricopeptide (TPR) repeat protein
LGLFEAAQASIAAALPIFELPADLRGLAVCRNNLSIIRLHAGDPDEARSIALQALADARAIENPLIEAAVLANLGNAERELREFDAALDHMHAAIDIRHRLGLQATFEELSDLALAQFLSGDRDAGRATADDIMLRAPASTENTVWPHYCFWTAACIYHGGGDGARAKTALELAVTRVREQLASTADDASRAAFLRVASVREVHAAADHGVWPEAFAAAPAPRRPVRAPRPS